MNPTYIKFEEKDMDMLISFYMAHYNAEGGTWTHEKAYRRLHQMVTMEDSLVMLQFEGSVLVGFSMGYFKCFDDSTGFFLEEILIRKDMQGKGYGTDFLCHLKAELQAMDCDWIELLTTTEERHQSFYGKNGYAQSERLVLEFLDLR